MNMEIIYDLNKLSKIVLECVHSGDREYQNAMTKEMDRCLNNDYKEFYNHCGGTYFDGFIQNGSMSIRFPGATRGGIKFNKDMIVTNIIMYRDREAKAIQCYNSRVYNIVKKYIGAKLIFKDIPTVE